MLFNQPINVSTIPETESNFEPLPIKQYHFRIKSAKIEEFKIQDEPCKKLVICAEVLAPDSVGRLLFTDYVIYRPSWDKDTFANAVSAVGRLHKAAGLEVIGGAEPLIGCEFLGKPKNKQYTSNGETRTKQELDIYRLEQVGSRPTWQAESGAAQQAAIAAAAAVGQTAPVQAAPVQTVPAQATPAQTAQAGVPPWMAGQQ